jgi:hypothetical protein
MMGSITVKKIYDLGNKKSVFIKYNKVKETSSKKPQTPHILQNQFSNRSFSPIQQAMK